MKSLEIVRPSEPEYHFHELFPGNLQPSPIMARSIDPEAVRTALNCHHDNFARQTSFNLRLLKAFDALNEHRQLHRKILIWQGIGLAILLGIVLFR